MKRDNGLFRGVNRKAWLVGAIIFGLVAGLAIWLLPGILVSSAMDGSPVDPSAKTPAKTPSVIEYVGAVNIARQGVLWAVGGVIAVVTLAISWAKHSLEQDANRTTRYTEAIKQLGDESIAVRLGGIYALERIAQDSERDHQTILDVLCAFMREMSPSKVEGKDAMDPIRSDVSAAATVVSRLSSISTPKTPIDLRDTNLRTADFTGADLTEALFSNAILARAVLNHANLGGAQLDGADLYSAKMKGANLAGANLNDANLQIVDLSDATLSDAGLFGVELMNARLERTDLTRANLVSADLSGSTILDANLTRAELLHTRFINTRLEKTRIKGASFIGANLKGLYRVQSELPDEYIHIRIGQKTLEQAGALDVDRSEGLPAQDTTGVPNISGNL